MSISSKAIPQVVPAQRRHHRGKRRQAFWAVLFLAPALIALVILRVAPTASAVGSSLYEAFPGGLIPATFAGFANYEQLFADQNFIATIGRTLLFNVVINPLQIFLALLIAVLMIRRIKLGGLWRTLMFIPITVPLVGSCIAWGAALEPRGPINAIIAALGGDPQPFLTSPAQALACIILIASWIGIGYWMLFLIAGLQAIPEELYEAARLDRAGPIRTFFTITIPLLRRPLLFVLVADTVANFVLFAPVQILTAGGPEKQSNFLMYDIFHKSYELSDPYEASAELVVLLVIMIAIVAVQFRLLRTPEGEE